LEGERDKYRDHRDDLADLVGKRVGDIMGEHMEASLISGHDSHKDNNNPSQTENEVIPNEITSN